MPTLTISDETFTALQQLARPWQDSPDDVLHRLLVQFDKVAESPASPSPRDAWNEWPEADRRLHCSDHAMLTHTRLLRASLRGNEPITKWNDFVRHAVRIALDHGLTVADIADNTPLNVREGRVDRDSFTYVEDLKVSVQGLDATASWRSIASIAKLCDEPAAAMVEWRDKEAAAYPGQTGLILCRSDAKDPR